MKYLLSAFLLLVVATACEHDPDEMVFEQKNFAIKPQGDLFIDNDSMDELFTTVWTAATFESGALTKEYSIKVQRSEGEAVELGTTQNTYFSLRNWQLVEALGIKFTCKNEPFTVQVDALSEQGEVLTAQIECRLSMKRVVYLYLLGAYQDWTENGDASTLLQDESGLFKGLFRVPEGKTEFKFTEKPNWAEGHRIFGDDGQGGLSDDRGAGNLNLAAGFYYVEVNTETLSYTATPVEVLASGEGLGGEQVKLAYNEQSKLWESIAMIEKEKDIQLTLQGDNFTQTLGGKADDLKLAGEPLQVMSEGLMSIKLSLFTYPYTFAVDKVNEDASKLYLIYEKAGAWDFQNGEALTALTDAEKNVVEHHFWSFTRVAPQSKVLLSRVRSEYGTRFGGDMAALTEYPIGEAAEGFALSEGLNFLRINLAERKMVESPITSIAVKIVGEDTPLVMEESTEEAGKWVVSHNFTADSKIQIWLNGVGEVLDGEARYSMTLGGEGTALVFDGDPMPIMAGQHDIILDMNDLKAISIKVDNEVVEGPYPKYLEVTGSFAHYNWNNGDASPRLPIFREGKGDEQRNRFVGFVDMYQPEGSEAANAEFKITHLAWNKWFGGSLQEGSEDLFEINTWGGNMQAAFGLYAWDVTLTDPDGNYGTAKKVAITRVGLIGNATPTGWDGDTPMTYDAAAHVYRLTTTLNDGEYKIRFNGGWDYNLGGNISNMVQDGANLKATAGEYDIELDLNHWPITLKLTKK